MFTKFDFICISDCREKVEFEVLTDAEDNGCQVMTKLHEDF